MIKHSKIVAVIATTLLLVTVIGASFAYFMSGSVDTTNKTDITGTTGSAIPISLVTIGDNISLSASSQSMIEASISDSPVATEEGTLTVKLTAGTSELPIECEYDIYYVWESDSDTYTRTDNSLLEFTYRINKNSSNYINETNYVSTTNTVQKIGTEKITSSGTEVVDTYNITNKFYNLSVDQTLNANKNFKIKYYIDTNESRCTRKSVTYLYNTFSIGDESYHAGSLNPINPTYGTRWFVANDTEIEDYVSYPTKESCTPSLTFWNDDDYNGYECVSMETTYGGIGNYQSSLEEVLNKTTTAYCIKHTSYISDCNWSEELYNSLEECQNNIANGDNNHVCVETNFVNVFLKHKVENDIVIDTEICVYANNNIFCIGDNYWNTDGETTKNHLKTDMENALGLNATSCTYGNNGAKCTFDGFHCDTSSNGGVGCFTNQSLNGEVKYNTYSLYSVGYCGVSVDDGEFYCK